MKGKTAFITGAIFSAALIGTTLAYAHVVDLEFISYADRYDLDPNKDGRDFFEWLNEQNRKEELRDQWVKDLVGEVAFEVAASFDPRLGDRD